MTDKKIENLVIHHQEGELCYCKLGHGSKVWVVFHGFGQDKTTFFPHLKGIEKDCTIYCLDLFFHGNSTLHSCNSLSKQLWDDIFHTFLEVENITSYSLLGYSLGGRFALASFMYNPNKCNELHLLATDGIFRSFWYEIATVTKINQLIFKKLMYSDKAIRSFLNILEKSSLVNKKVSKFASMMTASESQRDQLYKSWVVFRPLLYPKNEILRVLNLHHTNLNFYFGEKDRIMPFKNYKKILNQIRNKKVTHFNTGHNLLISEALSHISKFNNLPN